MKPDITPIAPQECFQFSCHSGVPCFNACCRDLNQFLTPYEILRLKAHLNMDSGSFLARYTRLHIGPATGLPIVSLKPGPGVDRPCPFVSPQGCRVYASRPASCRIYPLMRGVQRDCQSGRTQIHYALLKEPHCRGFEQPATHSVNRWIASQGLEPFNAQNDRMAPIIAAKRRSFPGPLDRHRQAQFRLALYDLDAFREQVCRRGLLDGFPVGPELLEGARGDDLALLEIGMAWITRTLFAPPRNRSRNVG